MEGEARQIEDKDSGHLRVLSICFMVYAVLSFCFGSVFIAHTVMGFAMLSTPSAFAGTGGGPPPPAFVGYLFIFIGIGLVLFGWICSALSVHASRLLRERRGHTFLTIFSIIICLNMPLGTLLGVFTIIILQRDSVKALFGKVLI